MSRIVALTGATGFIGQVLWRRLEEAGWAVRALIRPSYANRHRDELHHKKFIEGTLQDEERLSALVDGVDAVVHCAGRVRGLDRAQFQESNVEGVGRIARLAASQQRPPRFVLLSSLAAREPTLSAYAWSKQQGEVALQEMAGRMDWIILRPPAVYGPHDRATLPLFQWIERGIGVQLGERHSRFSLLYVDDLTAAVVMWLERGPHAGLALELHDGHAGGYSWADVFELVGGKSVIRFVVPKAVLSATASINQALARIFRYDPILTYGKVRELRHPHWVCDNTELTKLLGWEPSISLVEGVRRSLHPDERVS
ncbi:MAG: short-chain dehydrogenase [Nitrospirales bacterium]|nr:MAG: short-chain dehydrogenase [Nitrospirales bacterium]